MLWGLFADPTVLRQAAQIMEANNIKNTYFLSKSLTERMLLNTLGLHGRLCIVRPSIVGAVAYEPCPGWVGNSSGFTALILGAASGACGQRRLAACTVQCICASD